MHFVCLDLGSVKEVIYGVLNLVFKKYKSITDLCTCALKQESFRGFLKCNKAWLLDYYYLPSLEDR